MAMSGTEVGNKAMLFIQPLLFRSIELMQSAIENVQKNRPLSALSCVRTHYEVTGTLALLLKELRAYKATDEQRTKLLALLKRLTLGVGRAHREEYPDIDVESVHALNRIRCVDEVLPYDPDPTFQPTMVAYNDLCEFVHINFSNSHMSLEYYDGGKYVDLLDEDKLWFVKMRTMNWLTITSRRFWMIYRESMRYLKQMERIPSGAMYPKFYKVQRWLLEKYASLRINLHKSGYWKVKKR